MTRHISNVSQRRAVSAMSADCRHLPASASVATPQDFLSWASAVAFVGWFFSKFALHL